MDSPNVRLQDGTKPRMLCGSCEALLSAWEREFARCVFRPIHEKDKNNPTYGSSLLRFAVSLTFRSRILATNTTRRPRDRSPSRVAHD